MWILLSSFVISKIDFLIPKNIGLNDFFLISTNIIDLLISQNDFLISRIRIFDNNNST